MAVPAASPTATPVIRRPISSPGSAFHAARRPTAAIIVATAPSIAPRRPTRPTMKRTEKSAPIVPPAKIAKTTVTVNADR
jgi:hypothetical protein